MKKKKQIIKYFIIISLMIIAVLPTVNFYQYAVKYDFKKLFNTDEIEKYVNYSFYKLFNKSLEANKVIVGKDDFLFLGNSYSNVLHKMQGLYQYNNKDIDNWTNKLKDIQVWYADRGIKFVIVVAPNKHSIYREKLPNWVKYNGRTITDDIVKYAKKKKIHLLDLRKILKEKKSNQLYFTTDTHWNKKGASIGYEETIRYLNNLYSSNYKIPKYDLSITYRRSGDLASFLKIGSVLAKNYETNYNFIFEKESNVCHGNINKLHFLEKCSNKKNPVMGINRNDQYMINKSAINKDKLLLLCDSFGTANSKLYNETFNTIWKFHYEHINGSELVNFVSMHKPDIVIYQLVQRQFYNNRIVKKLSRVKGQVFTFN